jgi:hypothetical protein
MRGISSDLLDGSDELIRTKQTPPVNQIASALTWL